MPVIEGKQNQKQRAVGFKRILIATDLSEASRRTMPWALAIARRYGSEVYLVHAIRPEVREFVPMDPLPKQMDRAWSEAEAQMKVLADDIRSQHIVGHTRLRRGSVTEVIASVIATDGIDLLVLGTHGRGGLKKLALGSVAEELLRVVRCPVMTIGHNVSPTTSSALGFNHIVFATDFGPAAEVALGYALSLAEEHRSKLSLLHTTLPLTLSTVGALPYCPAYYAAEEVTKWEAEQRKEDGQKLRTLVPPESNLAFDPEYVVITNFTADAVQGLAEERKADLIVMGAQRTGAERMAAHDPATILHNVIAAAKCPVLTVMA